MGNRSYESLIKEIKGRLSITNLVGNYLSLKRSGKGYVGLCPFHDDKNPSLHVNDDKGLYHCFSCGAGGDIVGFLMRYNNISFHDALQELAKKANIRIEDRALGSQKPSRKKSLYRVNNLVSLFYHNLLIRGAEGKAARNYIKTRGLSEEIIKEFHLGYAPDSWDGLVNFLNKKKIPPKVADEIGVIIKRKDKEGFYDRFRNRIIFPIRDVDCNVVGFGGRVLDNEIEPGYLNSPESEIYQKRNILYGLEKSRDDIRRKGKVIVVEGYMDFLSLYSAGIRNVVATLGTSLTHEHAVLLRRFTDQVVVVFDGDKSGQDASIRVLEIFLKAGIVPLMVVLPEGSDPDSIISNDGYDKILRLIENADSLLNFFIEKSFNEFKQGLITWNKAVQNIVKILTWIEETTDRYYIRKTSEIFGIREEELYSLINKQKRQSVETSSELERRKLNTPGKILLKVLLKFPHLIDIFKDKKLIEYIDEGDIRDVIDYIVQRQELDVSSLLSSFNNNQAQEIISESILFSDDITNEAMAKRMLNDCIRKFKLRKLENKLRLLKLDMKQAAIQKDDPREKRLIKEYQEIRGSVEKEKLIFGEFGEGYED